MGYFAGITTPIEDRHPITIKNLPFGMALKVFHSSAVEPCYELMYFNPHEGDKEIQLVRLNNQNCLEVIAALHKLMQENKDVGYDKPITAPMNKEKE